ncbi:hypothetical protein N657DRAFT_578450 [Parathielavia appendiculata]|uniref:Uncharacterized protein n=1 Tax=Parathielavia appendiculata TaxID=2587402 RepID=A0AAN6TVQ2_9PEZI|nr:hypothetical protein N657DRAFT_578450 [Parathielavia appendiculata]
MPPDQGAKFHHAYCAFPDHDTAALSSPPHAVHPAIAARSTHETDDAHRIQANASAELPLRPPFAVLSGREEQDDESIPSPGWDIFRRAASAIASFERRQWACPSGTRSCSSIGYPNSCCGESETCMEVPDTGLGPVGCCPSGATCGGGISGCADGSTACGSELGGGCCIPGFVCQGVGCVRSSPSAEPPTLTTLTTTSTSIISLPTPSTILVTVVITITPSTTPQPITSTTTSTITASTSSGSGAGAPFRPTSSSDSPDNTNTNTNTNSPSLSSSSSSSYCPTGFYPCLARAGGGCCQTGRDCATTTCPPPPTPTTQMTTVVDGNGVTVVVPVGSGGGETTAVDGGGGCAGGWYLCGSEGGDVAGCCPTGYECGTASCFAVVSGTRTGIGGVAASVAKGLAGHNGGGRVGVVGVWWVVVVEVGGVLAGLI